MKFLNALLLLSVAFWGITSAQFFLQSWLAAANAFVYLGGFLKGAVPRKNNSLALGVAVFSSVLFSILLWGGFRLLGHFLSSGWTKAESVTYWLFAVLSLIHMLPQIPSRIRTAWRNAMVRGAVESDILERRKM